ncbi:porin [Paraburkholderia sediminicola]|uniref:porin n=1 Tax=Paraburkholderia sediminicola TaxID=458836 RepID=UPI0038BA6D02
MEMKWPHGRWATAIAVTFAAGITQVHAQSSVQIGGLVSAGVNYTTNVGGSASTFMAPAGVWRPNIFFIRGTEDLGGGLKSVFLLSSLFSIANGGNAGGPGSMFSRESYVGLSNQWGTLTAGQHRDFMFDLSTHGYSGLYFAGRVGGHQGPFANFGTPYSGGGSGDFDRVNGEQIDNSVKFTSAEHAGLTFGALYGFGGQAGNFGASSASSFGANYANGPFGLGAAYTMTKDPQLNGGNDGFRNIGIGASWRPGFWKLAALATWSRNTATGGQIAAYDASVGYDFTPAVGASLTYTYMNGNQVLQDKHSNQLAGIVTYNFSKRTTVYLDVSAQRASGPGAMAQIYATPGASSSASQVMTSVGVQTVF